MKSKSEKETSKLAKLFAEEILKTERGKKALTVGLTGELGAGKTTFIKSFARALGVKTNVVSPTFIFSRPYSLTKNRFTTLWHFDAYRVAGAKDAQSIGLKEAVRDPQNLVIIEWADKLKRALPKGTIWIELKHGQNPHERDITFNRR